MSRRVASAFLISAVVSLHAARAQCDEWSSAFRAGGTNAIVTDFEVFDLGSGPQLIACGGFTRASGAPVEGLVAFDGQNWNKVDVAVAGYPLVLRVIEEGDTPVLYVGGSFNAIGGVAANNIARYSNGVWSSLAQGTSGRVFAIEPFTSGGATSLYVGGEFYGAGAVVSPGIARWDGTSWATLGGVTDVFGATVHALRAFDDGSGPALYVGGYFSYAGGSEHRNLVRWNGSSWSTVLGDPNGRVEALEVYDDGTGARLIAAGWFTSIGGVSVSRIARWDGSTWAPLGAGVSGGGAYGAVHALALHDEGLGGPASLIAAGLFTNAGAVAARNVARWNGTAWSALADGVAYESFGLVSRDLGAGQRLLVGAVTAVESSAWDGAMHVWDGASWTELGPGNAPPRGIGLASLPYDDGSGEALYVGGTFREVAGLDAGGVARWNGASWETLDGGIGGQVRALAAFDDGSGIQLYAAGSNWEGNTKLLERWNGSTWSSVPGESSLSFQGSSWCDALVVFDDGTGAALYLGGGLYETTTGAYGVLRYRGGAWSSPGALPELPLALAVHDDGGGATLYAAGSYGPGSASGARVYRLGATGWSIVGGTLTGEYTNPDVYALHSFDDGSGSALYAAGDRLSFNGSASSQVLRWRNGVWEAFGSGMNGRGRSLAIADDGSGAGARLWLGGEFTRLDGGAVAEGVAMWDGASWTGRDGIANYPGTSAFPGPSVRAFTTWNDGSGRDVYAVGNFERAGANVSTNIARLEGCGETGKTFCYGDGSATACPCGNASLVGERAGCVHSLGLGATLRGRGEPAISRDTLVLDGGAMPPSSALYFQAANLSNGGFGVTFGDGLKCTNGPFIRLGSKVNAGDASRYPEAGDAPISVKGQITGPGTRRYQVRYRNAAAFCTADTFNYTNGLQILWRL